MHVPGRYAFVPVEGPVVLFDGEAFRETAEELVNVSEYRAGKPISFFFGGPRLPDVFKAWAAEIADLFARYAGRGERLACDCFSVQALDALRGEGLTVGDVKGVVELARCIKSADEIACMSYAIAVAEVGIARMREALRPGMSENELWSILHQTNIAMGGEWIEGRLLSAGDRTNPWQQESSPRLIRAGELVAFDTDMVGPFGYCADISRTIHCGPGRPTDVQRDLYKYAYDEIQTNMALLRAGMTFKEFSDSAWKQPPEFVANRYTVVAHGIGMCDEYPAIYYAHDWPALGYDGVIEEGMTLCIESYIGHERGNEGVKLEEQVLVRANGIEVLSKFPFEAEILR